MRHNPIESRLKEYCGDSIDDDAQEQEQFLLDYRSFLVKALDEAIEKAIQERTKHLSKKTANGQEENFLKGLYLFHHGRSMSEIAKALKLQAQYQVTRLLKLKEFRSNVKQILLELLQSFVVEKAKEYGGSDFDNAINHRVSQALEDSAAEIFEKANASAMAPKPTDNLFARRVCYVLEHIHPKIAQMCNSIEGSY